MTSLLPWQRADDAPNSRLHGALQGGICGALAWFLLRDLGILDLIPLWRGATATIFVAALLGAYLGQSRARFLAIFGAWGALLLWLVVAYTPVAERLAWPLVDKKTPVQVDAIVVLLANIQQDNDFGTPSLERTLHGLGLLQQGFAPRLILTQAASPSGSHRVATTQLMRNLGLKGALEVVGPVSDTHDEAVAVKRLCESKGWRKILLVTSPVHSRRSALVFAKTGLEVVSTPCRETSYDMDSLNVPGERIKAFDGAIHEIVGLRVYRARGWI